MDRVEDPTLPNEKKYQLISELLALSQENPSPTPDSRPHSLVSYSLVQKRADEIDQLGAQLKRERITILRQWNRHQSPIHRLPREVLAEILAYTVPDFDLHPFDAENRRRLPPTKLAAVSAHFCEVVFATPRLWTSINLSSSFWQSSSRELVIALYLNNLQRMGLSIEIDGFALDNELSAADTVAEAESFNLIFITNITEVKALRFMPSPESFESLQNISTTQHPRYFANLKSFCIVYAANSRARNIIDIHHAPRLENVTIVGGRCSRLLPWTQIKHLELSSTDSLTCLQILIQCPNLISLGLKNPLDTHNDPPFTDVLASEITFEHLQILHLKSVVSHG